MSNSRPSFIARLLSRLSGATDHGSAEVVRQARHLSPRVIDLTNAIHKPSSPSDPAHDNLAVPEYTKAVLNPEQAERRDRLRGHQDVDPQNNG